MLEPPHSRSLGTCPNWRLPHRPEPNRGSGPSTPPQEEAFQECVACPTSHSCSTAKRCPAEVVLLVTSVDLRTPSPSSPALPKKMPPTMGPTVEGRASAAAEEVALSDRLRSTNYRPWTLPGAVEGCTTRSTLASCAPRLPLVPAVRLDEPAAVAVAAVHEEPGPVGRPHHLDSASLELSGDGRDTSV